MFDPESIPDFESTPFAKCIEFTRAVAVINGDHDHPIQDHLDQCERTISHLESCFQSPAYFK